MKKIKIRNIASIVGYILINIIVISVVNYWGQSHNIMNEVPKKLGHLYTIEKGDIVLEIDSSEYVRKMKADNIEFYAYTYTQGNGIIGTKFLDTSILSSVYEKYKSEIQKIGQKYNFDVKFNFSPDKYSQDEYFGDCQICKGHFLSININKSQEILIKDFIEEILAIKEIKNLYKVWEEQENYDYQIVHDFSEIIIDGERHFESTIFDYYKKYHQNK